ncbi:glycosyltransferase family 9 protein [Microlunatus capsulatus]|uniref:ADP-heptose:LPS heptosyltransferase n=1 Tax=Microlunatus capsulatus TaxID=99117 RepID=A0ABS4Z9E7_9ACTN|nr:glycosyltransferase family 9 protein [Microlunatus capsulatus]MBP2417678.1 ADP-heptose:LPS heptosyltransferase [Microlunatus capsulatus]
MSDGPSAGPGRAPVVGALAPRFDDVTRIAVLRGGGLGDLVFALPAAEALAAAYPGATLTLLGAPGHAALLAGRPSPFADVVVLPVRPGVRDGVEDPAATAAFLDDQRARGYDLAVQVHGGGANSNPFLLALGARHTVGLRAEDAPALERTVPYLYYQHEVLRALEVAALAGAPAVDLEPRLRLTPAEEEARRSGPAGPPLVVLHPGATDPRRRWPPASFAAVAAALAAEGADVVVVGDASEVGLAEQLLAAVPPEHAPRVRSTAGRGTLPELVDLLLRADLVVADDSGPRHVAAALGTPTVGVYWFGNALNAGALSRGRHRLQLAWTTQCPVCGVDVTALGAPRCPHDDSFVADVPVAAVLADARALLAGADRRSGDRAD